jgi:hypothetical protein
MKISDSTVFMGATRTTLTAVYLDKNQNINYHSFWEYPQWINSSENI